MIALIDIDSVAFYIGNGKKVIDFDTGKPALDEQGRFIYEEKSQDELENAADYWMNKILDDCQCDSYIGFIHGHGNYRKRLCEIYKANRPKQVLNWWKPVKDYLISKWGIVEINEIEVDDAINIYRLYTDINGEQPYKDSFICAIDQDLLMLHSINPHYNWVKGEWIEVTQEEALKKFWSDMCAGQSSDNIKALKGRGIKYAEKLLASCLELGINFSTQILEEYITMYGEEKGIENYYITYKLLKILDKPLTSDFELVLPRKIDNNEG